MHFAWIIEFFGAIRHAHARFLHEIHPLYIDCRLSLCPLVHCPLSLSLVPLSLIPCTSPAVCLDVSIYAQYMLNIC